MESSCGVEEKLRNSILKTSSSVNIMKTSSSTGSFRKQASLYTSIQLPDKPKRPVIPEEDSEQSYEPVELEYFPSQIVQEVLNNVKDQSHRSHKVFCQLDILKQFHEELEWRESARWVKFEEVVEEGGKRWSKPHVATLSMHALLETRKLVMEGLLLLDLDIHTMGELTDSLLDYWIEANMLDQKLRAYMRDITMKKHKHRHMPRSKSEKDLARGKLINGASTTSLVSMTSQLSNVDLESQANQDFKPNSAFMRKIPKESEVCNIMVGELDELEEPIFAFIRLKEARHLESISEVKLPTKFVVFVFGPTGFKNSREIGRCIATMMIDDVFREMAYKFRDMADIIAGFDEFVEQVTVLPPSEWNPVIRIDPPSKVQSQLYRTKSPLSIDDSYGHNNSDDGGHGDDPHLQMSKIPFSGLVNDVKRKLPWYWSDFKDGIHVQCIAAFVYVFLGTFTPNVTFGGLLGQATDQYMGVMECIFAAAVSGILFALFSGQPLNILGSTGPMLVLEMIIYNLCKDNGWDFMPARLWIGLWTGFFMLLIVVFNLSALVKYITRFTEESFATLIAVIFIVEAFSKLLSIETDYPINTNPDKLIPHECTCIAPNCTNLESRINETTGTRNFTEICSLMSNSTINWSSLSGEQCLELGGNATGPGCVRPRYVADVFFFSILLFLGTFGVSVVLKDFKQTTIFPTFIRQLISDFAVLLSIILWVVVDILLGIKTPKLMVPDTFQPTRSDRGWLISPLSDRNPWWLILAAIIPALLAVILIFLDQQITAVIVNRKENKMKKGVGYHLDMAVLGIIIIILSVLGLPWYVAATVSSLAHISSLKRESECAAPGEKPQFLGCRENRVTALAIGVLSGAAVFITNILKVIPMPVLYGVFFYMGFSAMRGMQLVDRLYLFIQPMKYQPDLPYLRHVQLYRVHIFTVIQVLCLGILWTVKSIKLISIGFPIMVLATGVVRKIMELYFTQYELKYLDDLLPGKHAEKPKQASETPKPVENEHSNGKVNFAFDDVCKMNGIIEDKKQPLFFVNEQEEQQHDNTPKINNSTYHL